MIMEKKMTWNRDSYHNSGHLDRRALFSAWKVNQREGRGEIQPEKGSVSRRESERERERERERDGIDLNDGIAGGRVEATLVLVADEVDVAFGAPSRAPAVLDNPIIQTCLGISAITNNQDTVIQIGATRS